MRLRPAFALLASLATVSALGADSATLTNEEKLRAEPHRFSAPLTTVRRLASVRIIDEQRDWYKVEADGGRSGWLPRQSLLIDSAPPAGALPAPVPPTPPASLVPRSAPRAASHALILGGDTADAAAVARLLGVPDANLRQPLLAELADADSLRRTLAAFDARIGDDDRAFVHLSGASSDCGVPMPAAELSTYLRGLARKADKVVVVFDGNAPCNLAALNLPTSGNLLALAGSGGLGHALLACLDGRAGDAPPDGLASGEALRRCAQAELDRHTARSRVALAGNPAIVPAPGLANGAPIAPGQLLQLIHAQRSPRRDVSLTGLRAGYRVGDSLRLGVNGPAGGQLYLLAARSDGFLLLHPSPAAPTEPFSGSRTLTLPARDLGPGPLRLLALVTDSPRNFMRAGFGGAGRFATAPADPRSLRDLPLEVLVGDTGALCQRAETRNLGSVQARQCSAAFGAALADLSIAP